MMWFKASFHIKGMPIQRDNKQGNQSIKPTYTPTNKTTILAYNGDFFSI
jgi:hypothetical protein